MVPSSHQIADLSVDQLHTAVEAGSLHPVAVVEHFLKRIEEKEDSVQAFVEVYADESLAVAQAQGDAIRAGQPGGPLRGVPFGVKDLYDVAGHPTRAGSLASSSEAVKLDSTAVARLRQAGAIVLGKTTTHEYAYGVATPPTRNPWDFSRIPGGSSGGSGAALAARFVPLALGSDTGGSIRIPAALCGVVGLKPTLGQVPTRGVQPCAWTLDHAGPMALTVRDAALALRQLVGPEQLVSGVSSPAVPDYPALLGDNIVGWKIGVAETYFCDRLAPDVASAFEVAIHRLE
ncbi:MAG: amidase, partial [Bifidobacteriaceae bacterium]|nr:amidase [Bifidobacteriaceae bacterium]